MALTTVQVQVIANAADGATLVGATVRAILTRVEQDGVLLVDIVVTGVVAEDNACLLYLWPNSRGSNSSRYRIEVIKDGQVVRETMITVPEVPLDQQPLQVTALQSVGPYPPTSEVQAVLLAAQGENAKARAWAVGVGVVESGLYSARQYASNISQAAGQVGADLEEVGRLASAVRYHFTYVTDRVNEFGNLGAAMAAINVARDLSRDWAIKTSAEVVAGQGYGSKKYASDAAYSADGSAASAAIALSASDTASAITRRRVDKAAGVADSTILTGHYFTTPSTVLGEAAIIWLKGVGDATDTGVRVPNTDLVARHMPPESGYAWALVDSVGRAAIMVTLAGEVVIPKLTLADAAVGRSKLSAELQGFLPTPMSSETGYAWALVDSQNRIGLGIKLDGSVVGKFPAQTIGPGTVLESMLQPAIARGAVPRVTDLVAVRPDDWHGSLASIATRTSTSGSLWEPFPPVLTPSMRGIVAGTASLQFRRTAGLLVRGKRDCGNFALPALAATTSRGTLTDTATWPPVASFAVGDYFTYGSPATRVIGGNTVGRDDQLVWDGSAWQYQAAPTPFASGAPTSRLMRDWWTVTAAGTWGGVSYAVGDRMVNLGFQSMSGFGLSRWYKPAGDKAEVFYKGEFDAAAGTLPSSPADGCLWQSSSAGTAGGFTFAPGDYLIRESGAWGLVPTDPITTVNVGNLAFLKCTASTDEWEVRRADKSPTTVGVQLGVRKASLPRRTIDGWVGWSDSMYGVNGVGSSIVTKLGGRQGQVYSFGGGTSSDVAAMVEREVGVLGDRYRGWLHGFWMGQNNQPTTSPTGAAATIRNDALRMSQLVGARDARFYFKSILGMRSLSWNGARMVSSQFEEPLAKTGALYELEQWYAAMFPGQWFSTRLALLAAAGSTLDPTFPGMTEAQVAATYGIVPFSFYAGAAAVPVAAASLVYAGTWSSAGLPSGGNPNDYYLRTGGGSVGSLIVNNAGVWVEPSLDLIHLSPAGADAMSTAEVNFINSNYW